MQHGTVKSCQRVFKALINMHYIEVVFALINMKQITYFKVFFLL